MVGQAIISGITNGSLYALVAIGLVMIYRASGVVNFAQGEFLMVGAYFGLLFFGTLALPYPVAVLLALAATAAVGVAIERLTIAPLIRKKASLVSIIIMTVGVSIVLKASVRLVGGTHTRTLPRLELFSGDPIQVGQFLVAPYNLYLLAVSVALMVALYVFFQFTKQGKAMRGLSQNQTAAVLMGIRVRGVFRATWAIGAALAAVSGILVAPLISITPDMGSWLLIKAFAAAVLGGMGSLPGAVLGGVFLGVAEVVAGAFVSTAWMNIIAFLVIFVVLLVRPEGLFRE